jgi:protein TonB
MNPELHPPPAALARPAHAAYVLRVLAGAVLASVVTLFLLWAMHRLIAGADGKLDEAKRGHLLDFVRVKREEVVQRRQTKPEKPPPPAPPPPQPQAPKLEDARPTAEKIAVTAPPVATDIELTGAGFSLGVGEGDFLPLAKIAPVYPERAITRGIEGYCVVEYTVTRQGTVTDTRVVESQCSHEVFVKPSLMAAQKFKYKPRIVDGQPVDVPGVRNKFTYRLED